MSRFSDVLEQLSATIESRKGGDTQTSYTAQLLETPQRAAKKLGEESVEALIAALVHDKRAFAAESADMLYHWLVLLASEGVSLDDVAAMLQERFGKSGLEEKAARAS